MMETVNIELGDESLYPDEGRLMAVLGDSYKAYCELISLFDDNQMAHEWRYYHDGNAWLCKVQKNKKTIVWMSAWIGFMKATIYVPEKAAEGIYRLNISEARKEEIRQRRKVGKSTAFIFEIRSSEVLEELIQVMRFKVGLK
ncbi:MAG: DUF3788 family protein [Anaerolineaceae bacterium]